MDKISLFMPIFTLEKEIRKNDLFISFLTLTGQNIPNRHKITSDFYDKRIFLSQKFWSHGTLLGYPGPGSQNPHAILMRSDAFVHHFGSIKLPEHLSALTTWNWISYDVPCRVVHSPGNKSPVGHRAARGKSPRASGPFRAWKTLHKEAYLSPTSVTLVKK